MLDSCGGSCICRTAWLYGYVGNNFVKTMLRLARENGRLKVVGDQVGTPPTSAVDLAYQLVLLGASTETGIFHCTCGGGACKLACLCSEDYPTGRAIRPCGILHHR